MALGAPVKRPPASWVVSVYMGRPESCTREHLGVAAAGAEEAAADVLARFLARSLYPFHVRVVAFPGGKR